jgi:hypothetical protein
MASEKKALTFLQGLMPVAFSWVRSSESAEALPAASVAFAV